ncbi:hypothetical protein Cgig2_028238 [Carnegiea gigantea]|uniref:BHLH domain-containing protein n=1 Tax=Carnegiea gigantea TaxID=171969 RepID=A0A9Q1KGB1_9CARY|nr:hypothetical protein Cgig2_028238 [Carnegiea gigantea]
MALARDQTTSCSFYGNFLEPSSSSQFQHMTCPNYGFDDYNQRQDRDCLDNNRNIVMNNANQVMMSDSPLSSSNSGNSSNNYRSYMGQEEAHPFINFKSGYLTTFMHGDGSKFFSFQQHQEQDQTNYNTNNCQTLLSPPSASFSVLLDEVNCLRTMEDGCQDEWFYAGASVADQPPGPQQSGAQQRRLSKRSDSEEEVSMQPLKKQCRASSSNKATKPKCSTSTSKDPQSVAAKNRRERISERLKVLQDLVPNGSKVDLVTMLEKAIGYVKFLQLQVKVLATDEFWPTTSGKAPDISQVREAIDAILSSQGSENATSSTSL